MKKDTNGFANLTKKALTVFGTAIAALTGLTANNINTLVDFPINSIENSKIGKSKPMPILKLNLNNIENSKFIASHASHRSHASHASHYSHKSGAMFS